MEGGRSVYSVMMKAAAATRSKTSPLKKTQVALMGTAGTFPNHDGEFSLVVLNLSTGKAVTAEIFDDGSFDAVTIEMESKSDPLWVGSFDGGTFVRSYVFVPRNGEDDKKEDPERCTMPDEEESQGMAKEFAGVNLH